jgi:hypothetical protein
MKKNILFINKEVFNKINLYHSIVGSIEWSGSILIKPEISDNVITYNVIDIIIECIGVSSSFETNPTEFKNFANNPEFDKCMIGLVHSHHSMGAFVSPVDEEELKESPFYPYISLVVAFNQRFVAKEAYKLEETYRTYTLFNGKSIKIKEKNKVITFDLIVKIEGYDEVLEEVNVIKSKKPDYFNNFNKIPNVNSSNYGIKNQIENYKTYNELKLNDNDISFIIKQLGIKTTDKNKDVRKEVIDTLIKYYENNQNKILKRFLAYLNSLNKEDIFFSYLKQSKYCTPYISDILDMIRKDYFYYSEYNEYDEF